LDCPGAFTLPGLQLKLFNVTGRGGGAITPPVLVGIAFAPESAAIVWLRPTGKLDPAVPVARVNVAVPMAPLGTVGGFSPKK
jgi:hypothetical protein